MRQDDRNFHIQVSDRLTCSLLKLRPEAGGAIVVGVQQHQGGGYVIPGPDCLLDGPLKLALPNYLGSLHAEGLGNQDSPLTKVIEQTTEENWNRLHLRLPFDDRNERGQPD